MRQTAEQRACRRIEADGRKWTFILFSAMALALWRYWGKRRDAIRSLLELSLQVWVECAEDKDKSMVRICEDETGIEIYNGDGASWHDVCFLNGEDPGMMTDAQWLYMRQQQIKWVRPQLMACLMTALHRKYGFGYERCSRIYQQIQEIEAEYEADPKKIRQACRDETGINVTDVMTKR